MRIAFVILLLLLQGTPARDDGQWTMPAKNNAATRYSGLSLITPANARRLHPVWNFSTGVLGGHEGQPLVVGSTMYVVTPFPNVLYAFDLTHEGYPLKWKYRPAGNPAAVGIACCDAINRGAVYAGGKIIYNLLDGPTAACRPGRAIPGAAAARRYGAGFPTIRSSTSSTSGPAIRAPTTPSSGRVRTSGRIACWRAGRATARWCGRINSRRTTAGTTIRMR